MKQLYTKSTHIFLKLVQKLGAEHYIKIESKSFMPLTLEFLQNVQVETLQGKLYSLCHCYVQNGDLMRDPEMCFIVVTDDATNTTLIYPQMYQQDSLGLYEESVHINDGKVTGSIPIWQAAHCSFANMWLKNILAQGFFEMTSQIPSIYLKTIYIQSQKKRTRPPGSGRWYASADILKFYSS